VECIAFRQTFDRRHLMSVGLGRHGQTGRNAPSVDVHGAGAALSMVAAFLGSGEVQPFAQEVEEGSAGVDIDHELATVDDHLHF
jgi:hypothetical protein